MFCSLCENVEVVIQFGPKDEIAFRAALNRTDGRNRVHEALAMISVANAQASVKSDKDLITAEINDTIGTTEFDSHVRDGLAKEYRRVSATGVILHDEPRRALVLQQGSASTRASTMV